jgi:hypothetical protein
MTISDTKIIQQRLEIFYHQGVPNGKEGERDVDGEGSGVREGGRLFLLAAKNVLEGSEKQK